MYNAALAFSLKAFAFRYDVANGTYRDPMDPLVLAPGCLALEKVVCLAACRERSSCTRDQDVTAWF